MITPKRITVMSLNLMGDKMWSERKASLEKLINTYNPDLIGLQQTPFSNQETILEVLRDHLRVEDDFPGWNTQGNIFWRKNFFKKLEHGTVDIKGYTPHRRLFWARFLFEDKTLLFANAQFTWPGHATEAASAFNPRIEQTQIAIDFLSQKSQHNEPVIFLGDFNEAVHPKLLLNKAGYGDVFSKLGVANEPTRPARPLDNRPDEVCDWIFCNDMVSVRAAMIPKFYYNMMPPSDHWPVYAVVEI